MLRLALLFPALLLGTATAQSVPAALTEAVDAYAAGVAAGDVEALAATWDPEAYADRVLTGLDLSEDDERGARLGAGQIDVGSQFVEVETTGSFRFLRMAERDGAPRARFRVVDGEGNLKYLDLLFEADAEGVYRLVDIYDFMQGEDVSAASRRIVHRVATPASQPSASAAAQNRLMLDYIRAVQRQDSHAIVDLYPRIVARDEDRKPLLIFYLQAASEVDVRQYRKALDLFERDYGSDPDAALVLIDHHVMQGDPEAALGSIDALDAGVGGDPFLDHVRANVLLAAGRLGEARVAAERLSASLPDLARAHYPLLDVALAAGDHATLADGMLRLERSFDHWFDPSVIKSDPAWSGFVASPSFKRWIAARAE